MPARFDVAIIGAGPAGMSAAVLLRRFGLSVVVVDEQANPGGQIWRAVEQNADTHVGKALGPDYRAGAQLVSALRESGAELRLGAQLWQIEPGWTLFLSRDRVAERIEADAVLLATGAQERPNPFPGWTVPGVLTVGAAQIALKTGGIVPTDPVWIAGSGPLPLLYMAQLLELGGTVAGYLNTTPRANARSALRHAPAALRGWRGLFKGARWLAQLRRAGIPIYSGVQGLEAIGKDRVEAIRFVQRDGLPQTMPAQLLLTHEGLVPGIHVTLAAGCKHDWQDAQMCLAPTTDGWGETSRAGLFVAGDGAGIAGAEIAAQRGEMAALGILRKLGRLAPEETKRLAVAALRKTAPYRALRPFLDGLYRPRDEVYAPADHTVVCRCEEVTLGMLKAALAAGATGPNQLKAATRVGMGPCQGRQCGYTVAALLSRELKQSLAEVAFYNIRPPLKPVTLGELASLHDPVA